MNGDDLGPEDEQLEGKYANAFKVGYNAFEFLLDFGQATPSGDGARFHSRIITSPAFAKAFLETLQESVDEYEKAFGVIPRASD
jgi:hypothetical protein